MPRGPLQFLNGLDFFGLRPHLELPPPECGSSPADVLPHLTAGLHAAIALERPDVVVAQGDTTSVAAAALAAAGEGVPLAHVEAGLRTDDLRSPFPEELFRRR